MFRIYKLQEIVKVPQVHHQGTVSIRRKSINDGTAISKEMKRTIDKCYIHYMGWERGDVKVCNKTKKLSPKKYHSPKKKHTTTHKKPNTHTTPPDAQHKPLTHTTPHTNHADEPQPQTHPNHTNQTHTNNFFQKIIVIIPGLKLSKLPKLWKFQKFRAPPTLEFLTSWSWQKIIITWVGSFRKYFTSVKL